MPLVWTYAIGSEVFALNNFFVALVVRCAMWLDDDRSCFAISTRLNVCAFICAVGLGNQHTLVLLVVPMVLWAAYSFPRETLSIKCFVVLSGCFLVPFMCLYGGLLFSAVYNPSGASWGDLTSLQGLVRHMLRSDYGTFKLYSGDDSAATGFFARLWGYLRHTFSTELHWSAAVCMAVGASLAFIPSIAKLGFWKVILPAGSTKSNLETKRLGVLGLLIACWILYIVVFHKLANLPLTNPLFSAIYARFWMQPTILVVPVAALGMHKLVRWLSSIASRASVCGMQISKFGVQHIIFSGVVGLLVARVHSQRGLVDNSSNTFIRDYGTALLATMPNNSTLLTAYDFQWTAVRYLTVCEGMAQSVTVLNAPMMTFSWFAAKQAYLPTVAFPGSVLSRFGSKHHKQGGFSVGDFMSLNSKFDTSADASAALMALQSMYSRDPRFGQYHKRKVLPRRAEGVSGGLFHAGTVYFDDPKEYSHRYSWIPHGLAYRAAEHAGDLGYTDYRTMRDAMATVRQLYTPAPMTPPTDPSTWEHATRVDFTRMLAEHGATALEIALGRQQEDLMFPDAILWALSCLEETVHLELETGSDGSPSVWKNLGLGYFKLAKSAAFFDALPHNERPQLPHLTKAQNFKLDWTAWKSEASLRVLSAWQEFVEQPSAQADSAYSSIRGVVQVLRKAAGKDGQSNV